VSKSPNSHRYTNNTSSKENKISSKHKIIENTKHYHHHHDEHYSTQNRVSFSFQPTTEYLQHFRNVGLTKLGAASSLKTKDAHLYQQRANLPRSQSVITCHQNLSDPTTAGTEFSSSKIDEIIEDNKESNETISHRYSQHYAKFDSDSSQTTTVDDMTTASFKEFVKEKDVSIKSITDIKKTYKKLKNSLNVPKNISKSVEMISKKAAAAAASSVPTAATASSPTDSPKTKPSSTDAKKNLTKINEYLSSNNQLSNSKSSKKIDSTKKCIKIIKPTKTEAVISKMKVLEEEQPIQMKSKTPNVSTCNPKVTSSSGSSSSSKNKIPAKANINVSTTPAPVIVVDKSSKHSAPRDEHIEVINSNSNRFDERFSDDVLNEKLIEPIENETDKLLNNKDHDFDLLSNTDDYDEEDEEEEDDDESGDETRDQTSYEFYKSYNTPATTTTADKNNYHYENNVYARQSDIYNSYRSHPSPAFFQPGYYPRTSQATPSVPQQPDLIQPSNSQNIFSQQQQQPHHHHMQYHHHQPYFSKQSSYYGSWYGSTPSLRVPVRNQNRQSSYFN
jgi:hypothetical protein